MMNLNSPDTDHHTEPLVRDEQTRLHDRLTVVTASLFLCVPLPLVVAVGIPAGKPMLIATGLGLGAVAGCSLVLTRMGYGRFARVLLLAAICFALALRAFTLGGVFSLAYVAWPVAILISGLFFGRRGIWSGLGVGVLLGIFLAASSQMEMLPAPLIEEGTLRRTALSIALFSSFALLLDLMTTATNGAFARLAKSETARETLILRYQHAAAGAHHGVWEFDPNTQTVWLGPGVRALLGEPQRAQTVPLAEVISRVHEEDRAFPKQRLDDLPVGSSGVFSVECRVRHADDSWIWVRVRGQRVGDGIVGFVDDVEEHKALERELRHRAFHDSLTGLPNRELFLDRLRQTLTECRRRSLANFAVVFVDLDRFKVVNDSLGHAAGDLLLIQLAGRLRATVREPDTVARLGGDEFTLLLRDIQEESDAQIALQRIQKELERAFVVEGQEVFVGSSMGLVYGSLDYKEPQDLLRDADLAMYSVKRNVDEQVGVFETSMRREMRALLDLDTSLRQALDRGEIVPWFQPIVNLETREVIGYEALARWIQADGKVLAPDRFIQRAEDTGLIAELDRKILEQASTIVGNWNSGGAGLLLSVNLSARQFHSDGLKELIERTMLRTGLKPGELQLEITEGLLLSDAPGVRGTLEALDKVGVRVAFDDFGTGYSSLSYLHRFDIEVLKIDRAFIQERGASGPGPICHAIQSMAQSLGIETVAEGVETEMQRQALLDLGCSRGQGYLFGAAEPAEIVRPT